MSKAFKDSNEEIFETFLIKEREQEDTEKQHAQETIIYMARCLEKEEKSATIFTKIKWFFVDLIDGHKLKKIKKYNEKRVLKIPTEDRCNKDLKHKIINKKDFNVHIFFNQVFTDRSTIADCGGVHYPYLCYEIYMQIEYSELLTRKQNFKEFEKITEAEQYYNELIKHYKSQNVKDVINHLTEEIDKHCAELKKRIAFFKNN